MTAVLGTAPPATEPAGAPRTVRTRLVVLGLVLAAAAMLGLAGLRAAAGSTSLGPVTPVFGGSAPVVTLPDYGAEGMYVVGYEDGATAQLTLELRNDGLLPITITSVALGGGRAPLLEVREISGLPLSIGPGGTGRLRVDAELANCEDHRQRSAQQYAGVEVGFSTFGVERTAVAAFDRPVMVYSPMIVACPDRPLDRDATERPATTEAA